MSDKPIFEEIAIGICDNKSFPKPFYIGAGSYKEAYRTKTPDNLPIALKIFDPNKCDLSRAEREIEAMRQCRSPYIGKLYGWGTFKNTDGNDFLFVIEEYLAGGTLSDRLSSTRHNTLQICEYGIALLSALSHLRNNLLVHRDIKPDNIMFQSNDNVPILVDFGIVRDLSGASLTRTYLPQGPCTPFFASPEQLNNDKNLIDWRSDQFSVGIVLGICLTGSHPFQQPGQIDVQTVDQVFNRGTCSNEFTEKVNEFSCGFLTRMVSPWPVDRFARPDLIIKEFENLKKEITG